MKRIFEYSLDSSYENIQCFLKSIGYSHAVITQLKKTPNGILKNNLWAYTREPLLQGDRLTICLMETTSSPHIVPTPLPLHIMYEDEDLLIINKPANMPVHPSQGNHANTLANALAYYYSQKKQTFIYRCINRLDRDTTGLLIIAKHAYCASLLSGFMATRSIQREYLAIVKGSLSGSGIIAAPIGRLPGSTIERYVDFSNGEAAITHWKSLSTNLKNGHSLISIKLETGRTHQIRIHMKHLGHPLPGDFLYHSDYTCINRQALHSHKLSFLHPITKEHLAFTCELPDDMKQFLF